MIFNKLKDIPFKDIAVNAKKQNTLLINAVKGFDNFINLELFKKEDSPLLVVYKNLLEAKDFYNFAKYFLDEENILFFPDFGVDNYSRNFLAEDLLHHRLNTLFNLVNNPSNKYLVIATTESILQKIVPKKYLEANFLELVLNPDISIEKIVEFLIKNNYTKSSLAYEEGTFAVRGDILDISTVDGAFRISFFDNTIEKIKSFDINNQITLAEVSKLILKPKSEVFINEETLSNLKYNYLANFGKLKGELKEFLDNPEVFPSSGFAGIQNYLPFIYEETISLADYINSSYKVVFNNNSLESASSIFKNYQDNYLTRQNSNKIYANQSLEVLAPEGILFTKEEVLKKLTPHYIVTSHDNVAPEGLKVYDLNSKPNSYLFPKNAIIDEKISNIVSYINAFKDNAVIINLKSDNLKKLLIKSLKSNKVSYKEVSSLEEAQEEKVILLNDIDLKEGFIFNGLTLITEFDVLGVTRAKGNNNRLQNSSLLSIISSLKENDYVTHSSYGIGQYKGLKTIEVQGSKRDFIEIIYQNNDKLLIPVENIDLISRYSSNNESITLDRLNSGLWEKRKQKIKEKLADIAYSLIEIAAKRSMKSGFYISSNPEGYDSFVKKFPYIETDDQLKTIEAIQEEFNKGEIVDRLVCGDVGFGKTEIALRAAYLVAAAGYQVAIIAPTTLLSNQHYNGFVKRFSDFPIEVKQLSRFVSTREKQKTKEGLRNGDVNIVIGTHALLAKDVAFNNLGLIIVDEEQNFGVVHKEKLKNMADNVNVITLTATPIPRTLQLALSETKTISLMTTPPQDKLPVTTYVMPFDLIILKEAIEREINRGGQIYYVAPYISDLKDLEDAIKKLDFKFSYDILHGQMPTEAIEEKMQNFQSKKFDVLLSTNIIESGLDLANVNTIIIYNSEKFGLSQLYQLRGRVGRSNSQAYCYMTYKNDMTLTEDAKKRLSVILNLNYLGAGFSLAQYDLDIRGAGNILGEEQSGHIKEIGMDLYNKLLAQEIIKAKAAKGFKIAIEDDFSPEVSMPVSSLISFSYIADIETKMEMYQKLSYCNSLVKLDNIRDEFINRFGKIPQETENLITSIKFKIMAKKAGVDKVLIGKNNALMYFREPLKIEHDKLLGFIKENNLKIKPNNGVMLEFKSDKLEENLKSLFLLFNELLKLV